MDRADIIWLRSHREALRRVIDALERDRTASESLSTPNGGSRSVTYLSLPALYAELRRVEREIAVYEQARRGGGLSFAYPRWC